jgi:hypothetical protein
MLVCTLFGPESDGSHFEQAKVAYQHGAGAAYGAELVDKRGGAVGEKNMSEHVEQVQGGPGKV